MYKEISLPLISMHYNIHVLYTCIRQLQLFASVAVVPGRLHDYILLEASSCKTHRVQLRRAEGQEVWRGDRLIGLRDWVYLMNGVLANSIHDTSVGPLYIPFGPDTKRKGGGGGGGGNVCFGPDAKSGRDC